MQYQAWSQQIRHLHTAVARLDQQTRPYGVASPRGQEWFDLLANKLLPQLDAPPLLVVAVVGGTNIGKSVVFNHLAGEVASAVSPLAAGTRHPVCLAPSSLANEALLARLFPGFTLRPWQAAEDALDTGEEHLLLWRESRQLPEQLLLLDTPDIDSDAPINWQRADYIRQAADVLVAVLTQQKYNDAAVKQFFRQAAAADKPVIVCFNQCDLEADREYWPQWLATFRNETSARPELVYVAPYDRRAAHELRLPFFEVGTDGRGELGRGGSLQQELASLKFDRIKIRTFRGALAGVLDASRGAPVWLAQIRAAGGEFNAAVEAIGGMKPLSIDWPSLPATALVEEIRTWWDDRRSSWSRGVHGFYRTLGQGLLWPVRKGLEMVQTPTLDARDQFHRLERQTIVRTVQRLFEELERLAQVGNDTLRPRLARLLTGDARGQLLSRVQAAHETLPDLDADYREFLRSELDTWSRENPRAVSLLRSLDQALALARPAITVTLVASGWFLAGGLVHDAATHAVSHTAGQLATDALITGGVTGGGEVLVSGAGEGAKHAAARLFSRLQTRYAQQRADWLWSWLRRELFAELFAELEHGAALVTSPGYRDVESSLTLLRDGLAEISHSNPNA